MLRAFVVIVLFQFTGEALARLGGLPVPGPVLGLALLTLAAGLWRSLFYEVEETAGGLLRHLALLYVPAGVGVMQYAGLLRDLALPIVGVVVLSTVVTMAVTALVFTALTGNRFDAAEGEG